MFEINLFTKPSQEIWQLIRIQAVGTLYIPHAQHGCNNWLHINIRSWENKQTVIVMQIFYSLGTQSNNLTPSVSGIQFHLSYANSVDPDQRAPVGAL